MSAWRMPRRMPGTPVEPPAWVRSFDPEAWRDDDDEQAWDWHAELRHCQAVNAWYRAHPEADHRVEELLARIARDRTNRG